MSMNANRVIDRRKYYWKIYSFVMVCDFFMIDPFLREGLYKTFNEINLFSLFDYGIKVSFKGTTLSFALIWKAQIFWNPRSVHSSWRDYHPVTFIIPWTSRIVNNLQMRFICLEWSRLSLRWLDGTASLKIPN